MSGNQNNLGTVVSLFRYPVKSMMGEELNATDVTDRGLLGDRVYALVDSSDGKVASAKNPRKWPNLFDFRASYHETPRVGAKMPSVRITFPDGSTVSSDQSELNHILSNAVHREVTLDMVKPAYEKATMNAEEYWPDIENLDYRDTVTDFALPAGTFFDSAVIHLLTTATLDRLRELYHQGRFETRRFRPNIVISPQIDMKGFIENDWIGHHIGIGDEVRISVTGPCARCVMTTLPQGDLPRDLGILQTAAKLNNAHVGVYASVVHGGKIHRGDPVKFES